MPEESAVISISKIDSETMVPSSWFQPSDQYVRAADPEQLDRHLGDEDPRDDAGRTLELLA